MEKIEVIINKIDREVATLNKIIEREEGAQECTQYYRGERYAFMYVKSQLKELCI